MKKTIIFAALVFIVNLVYPSEVSAQGLEVDWGPGGKVFDVSGLLPGDDLARTVSVRNDFSGTVSIELLATKQLEEKNFSEVLDFVVIADGTEIYNGLLKDFFGATPLLLFPLGPGETKNVDFDVHFQESAGNDYQLARVVFDLEIRSVGEGSIVINEVFYNVDSSHGHNSPKDKGLGSEKIFAGIIRNGTGSVNGIDVSVSWRCLVYQTNTSDIINNINVSSNTGGNSANNNSGSVNIRTGGSNVFVGIFNLLNINRITFPICNRRLNKNHEWVELYNPTNEVVSLKGWGLMDNSGMTNVFNPNINIGPGEFVLVARDSSVWSYWNEPSGTKKINLGKEIGDGLDDDGDHLYLLNGQGQVVDQVGWGDDTEIWDPAVSSANEGHSIEREPVGKDTDMPDDWIDRNPPTPGE